MLLAVIGDVVWQALIAAVLAIALAWINRKLTTIHTLVNSNYGASLRTSAVALSRVADMSVGKKGHDKDVLAAKEAWALLKEHEAGQAKVDADKGP